IVCGAEPNLLSHGAGIGSPRLTNGARAVGRVCANFCPSALAEIVMLAGLFESARGHEQLGQSCSRRVVIGIKADPFAGMRDCFVRSRAKSFDDLAQHSEV